MFPRFYLVIGLLSIAVYGWAQHRGVDMFTNEAAPQSSHSSGGHGSSLRTSHK